MGILARTLNHLAEPRLLFPVVAVVLLAVVWGSVYQFRAIEKAGALQAAATSSRELTETYEAQVVRALSEIDLTLKVVKYSVELGGGPTALSELEARELLPPSLVFAVSIADETGRIVAGAAPGDAESVAGKDFFEAQREYDAGVVVSQVASSATVGEQSLHFSRRIDTPDGDFDGAAILAVDGAYFVSGYEGAMLGERGVLALLGSDGVFRVRRTGEAISTGDRVDYAAVLAESTRANEAGEAWLNPWDDERRYTILRPLYGMPLAVVVGLSRAEQLAPVLKMQARQLWWAAGGSALLLLFLMVLGRTSWQLAQTRQRAVAEQLAHADQVQYLAYHDSLTGLPNRMLFSKLLSERIGAAATSGRVLAVMFLDLDRFKHINDTLGHEAGDELLQTVAARLRACMRSSDVVARLGGDEFVVMLPQIENEQFVAIVAQKVLSSISKPFTLLGQEFRVTASLGISLYPRDGSDEQSLKKKADIAMYQAKSEGKNNFQFYSPELDTDSLERLTLESSLRKALERSEFELHYQAKREIQQGVITGMEALLRWRHPELGVVAPMQFIPVAEETGLIVSIGNWVLRTACAQNVAWQKEGAPRLVIAVNLSARQFSDEHLLADLTRILRDTGMDPALLELEITEGMLMHNVERTLKTIKALRELGIRIAIDDFGLGYSSLAALQRFPLDTIKIDRSFIRDFATDSDEPVLAESIIQMGRSLSLTVVAQGVETRAQVDFLREHACDELQGFYVNPPIPAVQFGALINERHTRWAPIAAATPPA